MSHMRLQPDSTQRDLQALVRSYLDDRWPTSTLADTLMGRSDATHVPWSDLATELGLVGVGIPDAYEGLGCGAVELSIIVGELGRSLYIGPYLSTAGLAVTALVGSRDPTAMATYLPRIARGELLATVAGLHEVAEDRLDDLPNATRTSSGWKIDGTTSLVLDADAAGLIIVCASTPEGVRMLLVEAGTHGVDIVRNEAIDPTRAIGSVTWTDVAATELGDADADAAQLGVARLRTTTALLQGAEDVGAAERCLELAVAYAKDRVQFGRQIGSFQAIKHRCADMLLGVEAAKATVAYAARAVASEAPDALDAALNANAAASDAIFHCATSAGQVFGGIGYTWEHPLHLYLRRAVTSRFLFGTAAAHRDEVLTRRIDATFAR
jgi:alkylation response protein AidB-like acyl-CoA dehydrogenase